MSITSNAQAFPQALHALIDLLLARHPLTRRDVEALMAPHARVETPEKLFPRVGEEDDDELGGSRVAVTEAAIREAVDLGLAVSSADGLRPSPNLSPSDARGFRNLARRLAFERDADFAGAVRWLYRQDAYRAPAYRSFDTVQRDVTLTAHISNKTKWDNFSRWARFLGLASPMPYKRADASPLFPLLPDATEALNDVWPDVASEVGSTAASVTLVHAVLRHLPVGSISIGGAIPSGLSFALLGLERRGVLEFTYEADAAQVDLVGPSASKTTSAVLVRGTA